MKKTGGVEICVSCITGFLLFLVRGDALFSVGDLPGCMKNTFGPRSEEIEFNLVHFIARLMIILMNAIKIKNDGDIFLRKVPMIGAVVQPRRVILIVVRVIEHEICKTFVDGFAQFMQL